MSNRFLLQKLALPVAAGIVWGWFSMLVNRVTGAFDFESGLIHNLAAFAVSGVILSLICAGLLFIFEDHLPFKRPVPKAMLVSTGFWLVLRIGGALLSSMDHERYHVVTPQTVQGLFLAILLGAALGMVWGGKSRGLTAA